jgi:hypothetical protein
VCGRGWGKVKNLLENLCSSHITLFFLITLKHQDRRIIFKIFLIFCIHISCISFFNFDIYQKIIGGGWRQDTSEMFLVGSEFIAPRGTLNAVFIACILGGTKKKDFSMAQWI